MKTGDLAKSAGVNIETIRYYERLGLISEPSRTESGYRNFSSEVTQRIKFIKRSQELGFTLAEIRNLLVLTDNEDFTCEEIQQYATQKVKEIDSKIHDLQNIKNVLQDLLIKCGETSVDGCPIIERLQGVLPDA